MADMETMQELKQLNLLKKEDVGDWLLRIPASKNGEEGVPNTLNFDAYAKAFIQNNITGKILTKLTRADLVEMGVKKVGDRALILKEIEKYRIAAAIANRSEVLKVWQEFRWLHVRCCYPAVTYKLTNSNIEIMRDSACFGMSKDQVDLTTITDVELESTCLSGCCYGTVTVFSNDTTSPELKMTIRQSEASVVHNAIKNAWEAYQASRMGMGPQSL